MTYNPWLDAHRGYPNVHIERHPILPAHAFWSREHDVIVVDESITRAERRCALAHEIAHMDTGDLATESCWFAAQQETNADKLAAQRLVAIDELAAVMRYSDDPREVAAELEVTLHVLVIRGQHLHPAERGVITRAMSRRVTVA